MVSSSMPEALRGVQLCSSSKHAGSGGQEGAVHFTSVHPCLAVLVFTFAWALLSLEVEPKGSG